MRAWVVGAAMLLSACWGQGMMPAWKGGQPLSADEQMHARRVDYVLDFQTVQAWEASRWWHGGDMLLAPIYVAVALDGAACFIPAADWAILQRNDMYPCQGQWRIPR